MKRPIVFACAALIILGMIAWVWWWPQETAPSVIPAKATAAAPVKAAAAPPAQEPPSSPSTTAPKVPAPAGTTEMPAPAKSPPPLPYEDSPARQEAEAIALNLRHYGHRFGGNPEGTNAEIVKALNGGNAKGARYLPQEHLRLNDQGELLDSFGTPYFFHQISSQEMEIRSAGPDKTLWTPDDIAVK